MKPMAREFIVEETEGAVGLIRLDRPAALNALNAAMIGELVAAIERCEADAAIGAMVIAGTDKAFAAGADVREMAAPAFVEAYQRDYAGALDRVAAARKPLIAAVAGHCLGGGAELAMMCDIVIAAETARFGQPEITLGIIPGFGGTQRLPRAIGKARAMDLILTGRVMDAREAEAAGLVSRVVAADRLMEEAMGVAARIAGHARSATMTAKECVNRAFEAPLGEGIGFERRAFRALLATDDRKEGMAAFIDKRPPDFRRR
jgi:enoyl-CoA hydratase